MYMYVNSVVKPYVPTLRPLGMQATMILTHTSGRLFRTELVIKTL